MKKTAIILMVLATAGIASAALVRNGGFDINAADWNASGGGTWAPGHVTTGGNPGGYLTLQSANGAWAVWYEVGTESLATWGIPAGTTITIKTDMIDLGSSGISDQAGLKIESWGMALMGELAQEFTVTNSWATYSFDYTIAAGATGVKFVFTNVPNASPVGIAKYGFDNASISFPGGITPALFPIPTVGNAAIAPANDVLSWTNPAPLKNPSDTILCDIWFRISTTPLADPNLVPSQPGAVQIVNHEAINSVDLSTKGITLAQDRYYYWKVNVIDPNNGGNPIVINGFTWSFRTGDAPPAVNAGADKYLWLTMNDGTPADGKVTFTLTGSYTDDGKSPVTTAWALDPQTQTDPATTVTIATPSVSQGVKLSGTHATSVTIDNTGWFFFTLTATDGAGSGVDTVNVGVYVDACSATYNDPADVAALYPARSPVRIANSVNYLVGDINGDCNINLADFAILAGTWLDCMSAKMGCTP
jgi:hypothetical protein